MSNETPPPDLLNRRGEAFSRRVLEDWLLERGRSIRRHLRVYSVDRGGCDKDTGWNADGDMGCGGGSGGFDGDGAERRNGVLYGGGGGAASNRPERLPDGGSRWPQGETTTADTDDGGSYGCGDGDGVSDGVGESRSPGASTGTRTSPKGSTSDDEDAFDQDSDIDGNNSYRHIEREIDMRDGLKIISLPSGYNPYVLVGWLRCVAGDEYEMVGARVIRFFGDGQALASLAASGPAQDTVLLPAAQIPEELHRLNITRAIPANEQAWAKECPRPPGWSVPG